MAVKSHDLSGYRRGCRCEVCQDANTESTWARRHGLAIPPGTYGQLVAQQGGVCAICQRPPKERRRLCIDHCHETGKVRGLLCAQCNRSIGGLGDQLSWVLRAAIYLERAIASAG